MSDIIITAAIFYIMGFAAGFGIAGFMAWYLKAISPIWPWLAKPGLSRNKKRKTKKEKEEMKWN